jgi:hypothetical protein
MTGEGQSAPDSPMISPREPWDHYTVLIRLGLLISVLTLLVISIWAFADYRLGNKPVHDGYVVSSMILSITALAFIWLGVFIAGVVMKGLRLARGR